MLPGFKEVWGTVLSTAAAETGFLGSTFGFFPKTTKHPPNKSKIVSNWKNTTTFFSTAAGTFANRKFRALCYLRTLNLKKKENFFRWKHILWNIKKHSAGINIVQTQSIAIIISARNSIKQKQMRMLPPCHTWGAPGYLSEHGNQLKSAFQVAEPGQLCHWWILLWHLLQRALCNLREENLI